MSASEGLSTWISFSFWNFLQPTEIRLVFFFFLSFNFSKWKTDVNKQFNITRRLSVPVVYKFEKHLRCVLNAEHERERKKKTPKQSVMSRMENKLIWGGRWGVTEETEQYAQHKVQAVRLWRLIKVVEDWRKWGKHGGKKGGGAEPLNLRIHKLFLYLLLKRSLNRRRPRVRKEVTNF